MALNTNFKRQATAATIALSALAMPFAAANADNTPPWVVAAQNDNVTFIDINGGGGSRTPHDDCPGASCVAFEGSEWSDNNPYSAAVSIFLGTKENRHPHTGEILGVQDYKDRIEELFAQNGVHNVHFFVEQNDIPTTGFALHANGGTTGPFVMGKKLVDEITMTAIDVNNPIALNQLGDTLTLKK